MSGPQSSHQFAAATALQGRRISTNDHELVIRQQPAYAKVFLGREKDRKPIDPPPIVQLRVTQTVDRAQHYLHNPYYFVSCSVIDDDDSRSQKEKEELKTSLAGTLVSSLHRLKDVNNSEGGFFVFGDLSVRVEGVFRLQFVLYEIRDREVEYVKSVASEPFRVHPSKTWPGMAESTALTRAFSDQGVRLRLRKEPRFRLGARGPASDNYERRRYNTSARRQTGQMESLPSAQQSQYLPLQQGYGGDQRQTRGELPGSSQLSHYPIPAVGFGGSQFQTGPVGSLQQPQSMYPPSEEGYRIPRPIQSDRSGTGQPPQYLPSSEGYGGGQRQFQSQYMRGSPFQQPLPSAGPPASRKRGHTSSDHSGSGSYSSRDSKRSRTDSESSQQPFSTHQQYTLASDPYGARPFDEPPQPPQQAPFLYPQQPSQQMYSGGYAQTAQEPLPRDQVSYYSARRLDPNYAPNPLPFEASATGGATSFRSGAPVPAFPFGQAGPPSYPFQPEHVAPQQYASQLIPGQPSITSQYGAHIYNQPELEAHVRSEGVQSGSVPPESYETPPSTDPPQAGTVQFSPPTTESEAAFPQMWQH